MVNINQDGELSTLAGKTQLRQQTWKFLLQMVGLAIRKEWGLLAKQQRNII